MNKIMLIGNLGRDPEMNYTPDGTAVAKFVLAVNRFTQVTLLVSASKKQSGSTSLLGVISREMFYLLEKGSKGLHRRTLDHTQVYG